MSNCCLSLARIISTAAWLQSTKNSRAGSNRKMASALPSNNCRNMDSLSQGGGLEALVRSSHDRLAMSIVFTGHAERWCSFRALQMGYREPTLSQLNAAHQTQ